MWTKSSVQDSRPVISQGVRCEASACRARAPQAGVALEDGQSRASRGDGLCLTGHRGTWDPLSGWEVISKERQKQETMGHRSAPVVQLFLAPLPPRV